MNCSQSAWRVYSSLQETCVCDHVDSGSCKVNACFVNAFALCNAQVPVHCNGLAREDQGENDTQAITGHDSHHNVHANLEPCQFGKTVVQKEDREFGEAQAWNIEDAGYHDDLDMK